MVRQIAIPVIAALTVIIWFAGDGVAGALTFEREAILKGEWWRLITTHWVHLNGKHLVVSLTTLFMMWVLFGRAVTDLQWFLTTGIVTLASSLTLLVLQPGVDWYLGLSGLLHGLLVMSALMSLRVFPLLSGVVLVAIGVKLGYEAFHANEATLDSFIGGPILVAAHLYGAAWGAFTAGGLWIWTASRSRFS